MKPVHIVLLVLGAALAGALAVRMTQPPPIPAATSLPAAPAIRTAAPAAAPPTTVADASPAAQYAVPAAAAPAPVYVQPEKPEPVKPVVRKNKPSPIQQEARLKLPQPPPYEPPTPAPVGVPDPQPVQQAAAPEPLPSQPEPAPLPPPPAPRQVTLRTGTTIPVRLDESLSSDRNVAGDTFNGSLAEPLVVDGLVIAERGAHVTGRILDSQRAGRVSGTAILGIALTGLHTSDGQRIAISTEPWRRQADNSHLEDAGKIGGGAALGAIIGAIAGGGKGAAIGAGIGGGAGVGTVMATRGKPVNVPTETIIPFRLASRVTITERQ